MKKTDNYSARVEIENIVGDPSKVDENSLFTLLTRLAIKKGRIFDMGIILASRDDKYSGHVELAEKRLPSQSTSIQSPSQFPYDRIELRSWRDKLGVQSFGRMKGDFDKDAYFSSDNAEYLMRRVAAVAVGLCLETPLQELDSVKEFSAEELAEFLVGRVGSVWKWQSSCENVASACWFWARLIIRRSTAKVFLWMCIIQIKWSRRRRELSRF